MIPKIIHYCWFGETDKPQFVKKCIETWKKYCPDYQFIEWGNSNFDINSNEYIKEAYEAEKFAFVADYVRLYALYNRGGIYLDTDVEVFKSFNDILNNKCVFGFEEGNYIATSFMAAEKGNPIIKEFFDLYSGIRFKNSDGSFNIQTNVQKLTELLVKKGLKKNGEIQVIDGVTVYPQDYFSPYDYINCVKNVTKNSYCIHYFYVSWLPWTKRLKKLTKKVIALTAGEKMIRFLREKF